MGLFGTSGIRRIADRNLLEIALKVGLALGRSHGPVVVARDTRTSGEALKYAVIAGLMSAGSKCYDAGMVPTPTLAFSAREFEAGVMITASHNPPEYNGIKIFNPDGSSYVATQQDELERWLEGPLPTTSWQKMQGSCLSYAEAVSKHTTHIMRNLTVSRKTRIVLDCTCGAASVITPFLLRQMGCDVVGLNTHPSGFFPHDAEPIEENVGDLRRICGELGSVGIVHDGDADRMMAIDEKGRFIPGDKLLVLLAKHIAARDVVTTVDASMIVEEQGLHTVRTKVGDTYVSEQLQSRGDFGGEPSGAWVFPRNSLCPDGIYAAALLASIASENTLSSLVDAIPQYPIIRGSIPNTEGTPDIEAVGRIEKPIRIESIDGSKLIFDDGWVLIRPSGTEPKVRITAEARTEARARQLYEMVVGARHRVSSGSQTN
jgi:phosphoglucosamine mutase